MQNPQYGPGIPYLLTDVQERVVGGFGIPSPLPATQGGAWEAGYKACLQVAPQIMQ